MAKAIIDEGGRGVVYGRNAIQRRDPKAYQRALCDVVKHGVDPSEAVAKYGLE
jgi:DhnA family fructose-bisphosphate aldolase class Ia